MAPRDDLPRNPDGTIRRPERTWRPVKLEAAPWAPGWWTCTCDPGLAAFPREPTPEDEALSCGETHRKEGVAMQHAAKLNRAELEAMKLPDSLRQAIVAGADAAARRSRRTP